LFLLPLITLTVTPAATPATEGDLSLMFKAVLKNAGTTEAQVSSSHYALRVHSMVCNGKDVKPVRGSPAPRKIELELAESVIALAPHDDKEILFSALSDYLPSPLRKGMRFREVVQRDFRPPPGRCAAVFVYQYWGNNYVVQSNKVEFEVSPRRRSSPPGPSRGR
jgi:hypothetical protein